MSWNSSQYDENPFADKEKEPETKASSSSFRSVNNMSSSGGPSWLQEDSQDALSKTKVVEAMEMEDQSSATSEKAGDGNEVPRMMLYTRVINLILSVCMMVVCILSLLTTQTATTGVLACYVTVFSCLLCCFETHLKQIAKLIAVNFGFMYSAKSRAVFMIFLGTILFSFSLFGKILGLCMMCNSAFNFYIIFKYPSFEEMQRTDATQDITGYLAANPAFASQISSAAASATSEAIRQNPDLAKQGAAALFSSYAPPKASDAATRGEYANV